MSIFGRFAEIVKANINDLLDKAEDPEKMIKQMVIEMEEAVNKATMALGKAIANEKTLQRQIEQKKSKAEGYNSKAADAVKAGRDDLARKALERKSILVKSVGELDVAFIEAGKTTEILRTQVDKLKSKLEEARMRESTLIARAQAAKAKKEIAQSISGIGSDAFSGFERFEQKIEKQESEAEAFEELAADSDMSLDRELEQLDMNKTVDDELAKLKESMGAN